MGIRGPAPKPTALRLLQGNPGHRPLNSAEPKPTEKAPPCPLYIREDPVAKKEWRRLTPILLRMRVLTEADATVLGSLCLTHSHLIRNLEAMRKFNAKDEKNGLAGMILQTKTGYLAMNQIYANVTAAIDQELKLCRELGLTPSARSRIQTNGTQQKPENKWAATKPIPTSKQA
jgi:P27 family predicted phage terminase small subunit